jgi:hypothetical protein
LLVSTRLRIPLAGGLAAVVLDEAELPVVVEAL